VRQGAARDAGRIAVGIGLRDLYVEPLLALRQRDALDVLEVMIDDALSRPARRTAWRRLGARWPLIAHGTDLGIGDAAGPDPAYLSAVGAALASLHVAWYSEHLSFLHGGGVALGHFAPLGDDGETLAALRRSGAQVRAACACPFLLENPADVLGLHGLGPTSGPRRGRAYAAALEAAGAGALLDLTNLVLDARNDGFDPGSFLAELPWERVVEVHLAGGVVRDGLWIDSHDHEVDREALRLLGEVARRAVNLRAVIIERDDLLPPLSELLREVEGVRAVLAAAGRGAGR
jgi:hypothetical protein